MQRLPRLLLPLGAILAAALTLAAPATAAPLPTSQLEPLASDPTAPVLPEDVWDQIDPDDPRLGDGITIESTPTRGELSNRRSGVTPQAVTVPSGKALCTGKIEAPHYSTGAGGAIAKVRVTCTGSGWTTVEVRVRGLLSFQSSPGAPRVARATSDKTQTVTLNATTPVTYYIPDLGSHGGTGSGYWYVTQTIQIVSPVLGTVGSETVIFQRNILPPGVV